MKRIVLTLITLVSLSTLSIAQNTLGLRLGAGSAYNAELSFQKAYSDVNRLELDFGADSHYAEGGISILSMAAVYQWHWGIVDNLGWYIGPGAMASLTMNNPSFGIGIGGQIGLDYQFNIPLQLSIDVRPMWNFIGSVYGLRWGSSLGIRYRF